MKENSERINLVLLFVHFVSVVFIFPSNICMNSS